MKYPDPSPFPRSPPPTSHHNALQRPTIAPSHDPRPLLHAPIDPRRSTSTAKYQHIPNRHVHRPFIRNPRRAPRPASPSLLPGRCGRSTSLRRAAPHAGSPLEYKRRRPEYRPQPTLGIRPTAGGCVRRPPVGAALPHRCPRALVPRAGPACPPSSLPSSPGAVARRVGPLAKVEGRSSRSAPPRRRAVKEGAVRRGLPFFPPFLPKAGSGVPPPATGKTGVGRSTAPPRFEDQRPL